MSEQITAIFVHIATQTRSIYPDLHSTMELSGNAAYHLRAILRLSRSNREILSTVDIKTNNTTISANICTDEGRVFAENTNLAPKDIKHFFDDNINIIIAQLSSNV